MTVGSHQHRMQQVVSSLTPRMDLGAGGRVHTGSGEGAPTMGVGVAASGGVAPGKLGGVEGGSTGPLGVTSVGSSFTESEAGPRARATSHPPNARMARSTSGPTTLATVELSKNALIAARRPRRVGSDSAFSRASSLRWKAVLMIACCSPERAA